MALGCFCLVLVGCTRLLGALGPHLIDFGCPPLAVHLNLRVSDRSGGGKGRGRTEIALTRRETPKGSADKLIKTILIFVAQEHDDS